MYRKYIYLYILIIIVFNIILFYNYKSIKETFGTINKGFNTFHVINILQRDDTIESLNNTRTECNKMGISSNKIGYGNNLIAIIENAIQELKDAALLGENIDESGFNFNLKVIQAQGSYICGEETALINSIEGQRPEVRVRPPYPAVQGLFNKPTVVNNVETLAAVHFIIRDGGTAYANIGTGKSTGTKLICLDSFFNRPGVYEIEMGVSLNSVINDLGQGFKEPVKALHIGGPLGGIVPKEKFGDLTIDFESFATNGFLLGHASVVSIPQTFPMIEYLEHLFDFASYESCGKCFPCRLGTKRGQELMTKAITGEHKIDRYLLEDLLHTLEVGSLCAHGGGIPLPIKNTLAYFDDELSDYFAN